MQISYNYPSDIPIVRSTDFSDCMINLQLLDNCLHEMKLGKAAGSDGIMAEHLLYAYPSLIWHLYKDL